MSGGAEADLRPLPIEWMAAAAVMVSLIAFALLRISCGDVAWHLATARLAMKTGVWPTTNTFSHSFPDYPLYQQYPLFDLVLYTVYQALGWPGLSALLCLGWLSVVLLFVRWAGPWSTAAVLNLAWMVGVAALWRRMMLRPDMISLLWLVCLLIVIDGYLRRSRWWIAVVPAIQLCWVNSHQLFPLGLAVQIILVLHLGLSRWGRFGVDPRDRRIPAWPVFAACAASVAACLCSPLGTDIVHVLTQTGGSVGRHRHHIRELAYIWERTPELILAILCAAPAVGALWRSRRRWVPFDVGVWTLSLILVLIALRGLAFFGVVSIAVFARTWARRPHPGPTTAAHERLRRLARPALACVTLFLAANVVYFRWVRPPRVLGGTQPGLGRSLGDWPDAAIAFLQSAPPPGRMMNMPWSLANAVIWDLPDRPVLIDARFEAYPRTFQAACIASYSDDAALDRLIAQYDPLWVFADHRVTGIRDRIVHLLRTGNWSLVYADTQTAVVIRVCDRTTEYLAHHRVAIADIVPADLLAEPADLRARQRLHFARLLDALEERRAALNELTAAEADAAGHTALRRHIVDARRQFAASRSARSEPRP